jgi:hypothetical protein
MSKEPGNIIIVSHRRSGTHIVIDLIMNNFINYNKPYINLDSIKGNHGNYGDLDFFKSEINKRPRLIKTHMNSNIFQYAINKKINNYIHSLLSESKIIYIYRNGKDVMGSLFYYMKQFDESVKKINFEDFIKMKNNFDSDTYKGDLNRVEYWKFHINSWIDKKDILFLSFEELVNEYSGAVFKIAEYINEEKPNNIKNIIIGSKITFDGFRFINRVRNNLIKIYYKVLLNEDISSVSFRKGKYSDYKSLYKKESISFFDGIAGCLMNNLGYYK